jgi:WD40 repeat protein
MDITPCQKYILYSTIDSHISLINLRNEVDLDNEYKLRYRGNSVHETINIGTEDHAFGIWSFKISGDGKEIICGTSHETLEVYDLPTRTNVCTVLNAHTADINTV